jgi:hypothetical protein
MIAPACEQSARPRTSPRTTLFILWFLYAAFVPSKSEGNFPSGYQGMSDLCVNGAIEMRLKKVKIETTPTIKPGPMAARSVFTSTNRRGG